MIRTLLGWLGALAISVGAAGCGNTCDHINNSEMNVVKKQAPCNGGKTSTCTFDSSSCNQALSSCTSSDLDLINNFLSCIDGLPTCDPNNPKTFQDKGQLCVDMVSGANLTTACQTALNNSKAFSCMTQ